MTMQKAIAEVKKIAPAAYVMYDEEYGMRVHFMLNGTMMACVMAYREDKAVCGLVNMFNLSENSFDTFAKEDGCKTFVEDVKQAASFGAMWLNENATEELYEEMDKREKRKN